MTDITRTAVILNISYNPASCHRVRLNMSMTSTGVLFNPTFQFLLKTHSAKQAYFSLVLKHDNKLASYCTSTMADLNYCILDHSYTAVYVFMNQKLSRIANSLCKIFLIIQVELIYYQYASYHWIIVIEYDQEIPQSQTADNPEAPRGRGIQPSRDTRKTN